MRLFTKKAGLVVCLLGAATAALTLTSTSASASSSAPRATDIVGVGSDTLQNGLNFLLDGSPGVAGGYNNGGNNHRVYSFDATGDAQGRATYDGTCGAVQPNGLGAFCDSTTTQTPNLLVGTSILRAGTKPVTTPNGSGAGLAALTVDANTNYQGLLSGSINFARISRLPNSGEVGACSTTSACGGLHVYQIALDNLVVAVDGVATDAPASLNAVQLANIYDGTWTTWGDVTNNVTTHLGTHIDALIPQSGSGTRNFFLADLLAAKSSFVLCTTCGIRTVEEHDPTGIYADPHPADAIEPFSQAKLNLIASNYFVNAGYTGTGTTFGGLNAYSPGQVKALTGTGTYNVQRGLYVAVKNGDVSSTTPLQAGGTGTGANFVNQLFSSTGLVNKVTGKSELAAAGFTTTGAFVDCGVNPTTSCP